MIYYVIIHYKTKHSFYINRYVTSLVETIQYYSSRFNQQEEQLARHVQSWVQQSEEKIQKSMKKLNSVQKAVTLKFTETKDGNQVSNKMFPRNKSEGEEEEKGNRDDVREREEGGGERGNTTNAILEERLFHSQASLQNALRNAEENDIEKKNLWMQVQQSLKDQERLERALKDTKLMRSGTADSMRDRDRERDRDRDSGFGGSHGGLVGSVQGVGGEEMYRLNERLVQAEQRAVQMSAMSAKNFAQSARTIAYLEGECGRLKTMLDHFRYVHI